MERDDRAPVASFLAATPFQSGATVTLGEAAAHHARVKRLEVGDLVRLTDGAGTLARGAIASLRRGALDVSVSDVANIMPPAPVHLRVPAGDRDRMLWLAEKVTELGAASWQVVRWRRSMSVSPRGEGTAFAEKVRARMASALEQSGGAWLPRLLPDVDVSELTCDDSHTRILLDAEGPPILDAPLSGGEPVILFGPEGGVERDERDALIAGGWWVASLADTTLRFETAGIAALAVLRAAHLRHLHHSSSEEPHG